MCKGKFICSTGKKGVPPSGLKTSVADNIEFSVDFTDVCVQTRFCHQWSNLIKSDLGTWHSHFKRTNAECPAAPLIRWHVSQRMRSNASRSTSPVTQCQPCHLLRGPFRLSSTNHTDVQQRVHADTYLTTSIQQSSNLIKSDLGTQCLHFKRTKLKSMLPDICDCALHNHRDTTKQDTSLWQCLKICWGS